MVKHQLIMFIHFEKFIQFFDFFFGFFLGGFGFFDRFAGEDSFVYAFHFGFENPRVLKRIVVLLICYLLALLNTYPVWPSENIRSKKNWSYDRIRSYVQKTFWH